MKRKFTLIYFLGIFLGLSAQNHTVGLIKADNSKTYKGYTLIYPDNQSNVYLIDNCGRVVHTWLDNDSFRPGNTVHLLEDGSIIKTKRNVNIGGDHIWADGGGGIVEKRDWNNDLIWIFNLNDSVNRLHHDIEPLINGNILMLCWEKITRDQAIAKGRDPNSITNGELWTDKIIEVKPIGKDGFTIVWEWHLWDHVIQDFDSTKSNFGKPANNIGKINLNYATSDGTQPWACINSMSYNKVFDQIVVSSPTFNEIWIIDHSTSIAESTKSKGGFGQKGGDLLYRWGNPTASNTGGISDQKLFYPNDIQWMGLKLGDDNFGKLMVFNSRFGSDHSTVSIIQPVFDTYFWEYIKSGNGYMPKSVSWTYKREDSTAMYSPDNSSVQRLSNGNTFICSARQGRVIEINLQKEIVWEYIMPLKNGRPVSQGDNILTGENIVCNAKRFPTDFPAFAGRDLSPKGFIELKPDSTFCELAGINIIVEATGSVKVFPNPANDNVLVELYSGTHKINSLELYSVLGEMIYQKNNLDLTRFTLDTRDLPDGLYFLTINRNQVVRKLEVRH